MKTMTLILTIATLCLSGQANIYQRIDSLIELGDASQLVQIDFLIGMASAMTAQPRFITVDENCRFKIKGDRISRDWKSMSRYIVSKNFPNAIFKSDYIMAVVEELSKMYEPEPVPDPLIDAVIEKIFGKTTQLSKEEVEISNKWFGEKAMRNIARELRIDKTKEYVEMLAEKNLKP